MMKKVKFMPRGYDPISTMPSYQKNFFRDYISQLGGQNGNIMQNPLYQQGSNWLQNLFSNDSQSMQAFEAPYMRRFREQTIPQLAEQFAGMGAGAQSSSGFQQALGQAGAKLSEDLASLRSGLQFQSIPHALQYAQQPVANYANMSQTALGTQDQGYVPRQPGMIERILAHLGQIGAQGAGQLASGGIGRLFT
jgi:hypothetical protein